MSASKKGKIGAIVGAVLSVAAIIYMMITARGSSSLEWYMIPLSVVMGALFGFGIVFAWPKLKGWLAKIMGVAVTASILTILFSRDRSSSFLKGVILFMLVLMFVLTIGYIMGIFMGIKQIRNEHAEMMM